MFASGKVEYRMKKRRVKRLTLWAGIGLLSLVPLGSLLSQQRTVGPIERGSIFMYPRQKDWAQLGVYVGGPKYTSFFRAMRPDAIKVAQGRFQHFCPDDVKRWAWFPHSELKAFEAEEVAAGRDPIFVTATYQGKKRPVYFKWSLGALRDDKPSSHSNEWMQAVNVQDDRYVRFWIERYARKILQPDIPNMWMGLDTCAYVYSLYGVLDDAGKFVPGVKWDRPFAQTEEAFHTSVKAFFRKLKQTAPDIKVMCNIAALSDWQKFPELYADVPGIMNEDIVHFLNSDAKAYARRVAYQQLHWIQWMADQNRVALLRAKISRDDEPFARTAVVTYLLVRGKNFFFAPQAPGTSDTIDLARVDAMQRALGTPTGRMESEKEAGSSADWNRLYWRSCQKGIVYLNLTGKPKTIRLPEDRTYYNRDGQPVREITVEDLTGEYVLTRS